MRKTGRSAVWVGHSSGHVRAPIVNSSLIHPRARHDLLGWLRRFRRRRTFWLLGPTQIPCPAAGATGKWYLL